MTVSARSEAAFGMRATLALSLCFLLNMIGRGLSDSYAVFLVALGHEFLWSRGALTGAFAISLLVFSIASPFAGALLDRYGHRALYVTGLACLSLALLLASSLQKLWQVYVYIGGFGGLALASLGMIPAAGLLRRWYAKRLGTAVGIAYTGLGCGTLLVLPAAQFLIDTEGWRSAYRTLGSAVAILTLIVLFLPWRRIADGPHRPAAPAGGHAEMEWRPALRATLRRPLFWGLAAVFFFTSLAMYMMMIQIVAYLIAIGLSPLEAATSSGIIGALSVCGMITSGWLAGQIGFRATGLGSYAITLAGIGLLVTLPHAPHSGALSAFVVLFGISQGTRGPLVATLTTRMFEGRSAATTFGMITACGGFGGAIGAWGAGFLYDASGGYALSFACACASILLAAVPFLVLPEFRQR